jgi:transglutaminase-like putative cysteine protease
MHASFDGKTERLAVISRSEIETLRKNAFDYVLEHGAESLPLQYPAHLDSLLAPYVARIESSDLIEKFTRELVSQAGSDTLKFLDRLNHRIHRTCSHVIREAGMPQASELTLRNGHGSCRDLTMVFIDACRIAGLAARFVSGYRRYSRIPERRYMHAWPEVFLPGGGWRGYDPSYDEPVIDLHVPVAASYEPAGAAPIEGAYFGESVPSTMEVNLDIGG